MNVGREVVPSLTIVKVSESVASWSLHVGIVYGRVLYTFTD